ncbi:efflux transporter [Irpex rosettiformis]|uniref:Efflux transporter n=1 Tax=Irpex rosettiformis TaxID=378272 RepID=A0ACB8TXH5_9APHY|nr:efflux transporter [Irpex rosettiformis]
MGAHERSTWESIAIIGTCTLSMMLTIASSSAASISLPTIGRDLDIVEYNLQWIVSAFNLSSGCLLLLMGRLADLYGRKHVFLLGVAFIGIFSLGAGFSQDEITLDVLRGIQGIGGAAVIPASLGILAHSFPPSRTRSIAFATFAAGAPMGGAIGNIIGGALTQLTKPTWRSSFFLIAGLSLAAFVGGLFSIDKDVAYEGIDRRVDWFGAFLVTAGLVFICFALSDGPIAPKEFKTGYIIALLVLGFVLLIVFLVWQGYLERLHEDADDTHNWWTPPPLMKVTVWTRSNWRMAVILWIAFFEWSSFQAWQFWAQLYYQNYLNLSPVLTMIRFIPMSVTGCICNIIVAIFVGRVPVVYLIVLGTTATACAGLLYAVIDTSSPYWAFGFPSSVISVFGADFVFASGTLFVAKISLLHEQSLTGALFQTMTQLGTSFGLAITTIIFNSTLKKESEKLGVAVNLSGTNAPPAAQLKAYRAAMWGAFAFGMFGALLAALFLRSVGIVGHSDEDERMLKEDEETSRDEKEKGVAEVDDAGSERTRAPRLSEDSKRGEKQTEQRVEE